MEAGCYGSRVLWKQGVMEVGCVMELMEAGCYGSRVLWKQGVSWN